MTADGREDRVHPVYDLLVNGSSVDYATAIDWNVTGEELGILHYVEGDPDGFGRALEAVPVVLDYELKRTGGGAFLAYVRDEMTPLSRELFGMVRGTGVVTIPPVEYLPDGTVTFALFGPADRLQAVVESAPGPVEVTVEGIAGLEAVPRAAPAVLSERQRAAVDAALELGYYEVPREATQADVAEAIGCAPSTAAEHLRKAEATLIRAIRGRGVTPADR